MWKSQFEQDNTSETPRLRSAFGVDPHPGRWVPLKAVFPTRLRTEWVTSYDADVQTPEPKEKEQTRFPGSDADQGRPEDPQPASTEGAATPGGERRLEVGPVGRAHPGRGAPGGFGLPPKSRITRTREIRGLMRRGTRKKTSHLDVFFLSSVERTPRVGIVVPKHHRGVVERNRLKRRLREISRRDLLPRFREEDLHVDLLIRARREAYESTYRQLERELVGVVEEICSGPFSWR